jgi:hypothetical protein
MHAPAPFSPSLASRLAEDLLKAWISGDANQVNAELERSYSVPGAVGDFREEERRDLLKAVAGRMRRFPDLLEIRSQDAALSLCVRLLGHLVCPD